MRGFVATIVAGLCLFAADAAVAAPGSAICRSLAAQLSSGGGGSQRYSAAADKQRREIEKVRRQLSAAGCGPFSIDRQCSHLAGIARSMNVNLAKLNAQAGGGRTRSQLQAAYNANGCNGKRQQEVKKDVPSEGVFSRLFGAPVHDRRSEPPLAYWNEVEPRRASRDRSMGLGGSDFGVRSDTVRTFCVRTCDGYYFPMSPSSTRADMDRDEQNCRAACPGAETSLYYHENGEEDAEAMISRGKGLRYAALKTAFLYRDSSTLKSQQCTCSIQPGGAGIAESAELRGSKNVAVTPLPANRPDPASDPETLANADGNLSADSIRRLLSRGKSVDAEKRSVRVVGPMFLPDPEAAAGPQVPAPTVTR